MSRWHDGRVLIAYLDESYTSERYYIAALIIDENDLPLLDAARAHMDTYISGVRRRRRH